MTDKWIGQRLREWRKASGLTTAEIARQLNTHESTIKDLEDDDSDCYPGTELRQRIEALINSPPLQPLTAEEQQMVERVVNAVRAGYVVSLIRPVKVDEGQIVLTFGDNE